MIIDAHHHLWTADYPWLADPSLDRIRRDYTLADLRAAMTTAGVDRTVLVEAGRCDDAETTAFLSLAASAPEILGVVGWASLTDPALAATLRDHHSGAGGPLLVGVRDQIQAYPDDHLDRPEVRAGLATVAAAGLVNEVVVRSSQLPSVARVVSSMPESTFVLDHLGKPPIATGGWPDWRQLIRPVAAQPNVVAKLSGLVAEADWASLQTTHDPAGMRALHKRFVAKALADPDPPGWWHAFFDDHPTGLQRIEMADAWTQLHRR